MTSWKTTVTGLIVLASVAWNSYQSKTISWPDLQNALIALGLVAAKDWNVSTQK